MAKRKRNQLLDDHQEWVEHVDNPGYWVNRISLANKSGWRWARQHHRLAGGLGALVAGSLIAAILIGQAQTGLGLDPATWWVLFDLSQPENLTSLGTLLLFLFLFIASLILFAQRPSQGDARSTRSPSSQRPRKKKKR